MGREIEGDHSAFLHHTRIIHHTVISIAVTSSCVIKDNGNESVTRGLIENLGPSPYRGINIYVASDDVVFTRLVLVLLWNRAMMTLAKQFKEASGQMPILGKARLVPSNAYALLFDVYTLSFEGQHIISYGRLNLIYIPEDRQMIGKGL